MFCKFRAIRTFASVPFSTCLERTEKDFPRHTQFANRASMALGWLALLANRAPRPHENLFESPLSVTDWTELSPTQLLSLLEDLLLALPEFLPEEVTSSVL
jgi:hypothetical protein